MKLDPTVMRTMNSQDFRVMEAVEKGMKNHSLVPMPLITSMANLRHGGTNKIISSLLRDKLLSHERRKQGYDGYRITNAGYDILALHNLKSRGYIAALGQRIGTGKESDIYLAADPSGQQIVLKLHRLGRSSFRNVRNKRDYLTNGGKNQAHSWLFLSRLSALKEYAFMKSLYEVDYPTPTPIAHNRHIVCMSLVRGLPLYQVFPKQLSVDQAADIYEQAIGLASRLAQHGLVHCDLNEFNLLVDLSGVQALATTTEDPYVRHSGHTVAGDKSVGHLSKPAWEQSLEAGDNIVEALPEPVARLDNGDPKPIVTLIDFPQMISVKHPNAEELYERDLSCLRRFFELKLLCTIPDDLATETAWEALVQSESETVDADRRLDEELRASGYEDDMKVDLELYYFEEAGNGISAVDEDASEEEYTEDSPTPLAETGTDDAVEKVESANAAEADGFELNSDDEAEEQAPGGDVEVLDQELIGSISREQLEARVKDRVRRQLEEQRRKSRKKGAFRKGNNNKTYVKGKRVMADTGM